MKSFLRRCLALVLVLAMTISGGINAFAASEAFDGIVLDTENAIAAKPFENYEQLQDKLEKSKKDFSGFKANEDVVFIVELEGESVLEAKSDSETAAEYMTSFKGNQTLNSIESEQENVQGRIEFSNEYDLEVEYSYKVVMNGMAVSGPYAAKEYLESIPGVKSVTVAKTYDVPEISPEATYASITSGEMLESDPANRYGYTGKGTVTAVLDTGLDLDHKAFAKAPEDPALTIADIEAAVATGNLNAGAFAAEDLYISEKVPFAFDYAEYDAQVTDPVNHGTHVCGTVGANCDEFTGVAPDTQIVIMKVFNDEGSGATDAVIFAALEDAVILGVDAINMSLGTPGGFTQETGVTDGVYAAVKAAGINLMVSAGNETDSIDYTDSELYHYGYALASNPDNGIVGSPSSYEAALSVASVNEYQNFVSYILSGEREICYNDANAETALDFVKAFDGQDVEYVVVPGFGAPEDYEGLDVTGKLALVSRGTLDFTAKEANAAAAGAIGLIVYDNVVGDLIYMANNGLIPEIFISMEDGIALIEQENKYISVSSEYHTFVNTSDGGLMSSFSSLGTTPDMSIKPEITAPGGYVYSTLPGGGYGSMSGTSMAAPHMAGAAAVMQQYVNETFPGLSDVEKQELINTLLMNTAVQVEDGAGSYASVRKQGAGLANVMKAIKTGAYVTVSGSERPKAELGDSPDKVFEKAIELTIHNFSDRELTYKMDSISLVANIASDGYNLYNLGTMAILSADEMEVGFSKDVVTVPAGAEVNVTVKLAATEEFKANYLDYFENGAFLEGYIVLRSEGEVDLSVPYLGFYGDWGQAPVFDATIYDNEYANVYTGAALALDYEGRGFYLGMNPYDENYETTPAADKIAISMEAIQAGYLPLINTGLLRGPKILSYTVTDAEGNLMDIFSQDDRSIYYYGKDVTYENVIKSFYYTSGGFVNSEYGPDITGWLPVEFGDDGYLYYVEDGKYYLNATAVVDGTDSPAGIQEFSLPLYIDNQMPELLATKTEKVKGQDYVSVAITDNRYMAAFQVISADGEYAYTPVILVDENEAEAVSVFSFNTSDLVEAGITSARLALIDYAQNISVSYEFSLEADSVQPESVHIINDIAFVKAGESFIVEAYVLPGYVEDEDAGLVWTSGDESIAKVEPLEGSKFDEETGITYYKALVTTNSEAEGKVEIMVTTANGVWDTSVFEVVKEIVEDPEEPEEPEDPEDPEDPEEPEEPEEPEVPEQPEIPSKPSNTPCNHKWSNWVYEDGMMKRTCAECGITDFVPAKSEGESNPNTGAPVSNIIGAMVVVAGAAIALKKIRK